MRFLGHSLDRKEIWFECEGRTYFFSFYINIFGNIKILNFTEYHNQIDYSKIRPAKIIYAGPNVIGQLKLAARYALEGALERLKK